MAFTWEKHVLVVLLTLTFCMKIGERKIPSMLIAGAGNGKMKLLGNLIDTYFAKGHTILTLTLLGN